MVDEARLRSFVEQHHALVWRTMRRFGVASRIDEAVSRVLDVVTRRLGEIEPDREQAFVIQVSVRVASEFRRAEAARARRSARVPVEELVCTSPSPEEIFAEKQARALLDEALDTLAPDLRVVLVLHELELWTAPQIADSLGIPLGTVASRLRRARVQFEDAAKRLRHRLAGDHR